MDLDKSRACDEYLFFPSLPVHICRSLALNGFFLDVTWAIRHQVCLTGWSTCIYMATAAFTVSFRLLPSVFVSVCSMLLVH